MSQLFRLASPEDYEYIEELNLWNCHLISDRFKGFVVKIR